MEIPGTILLVSGELARYADCIADVMQTQRPENTLFVWERGCSVVDNLNRGIRKMQGEWLWIMGDDHRYAPDLLMRLLKHEVDIVVPLVSKRSYPFQYVVYDREIRPGLWKPTMRSELPPTGLYEAKAATNAGMLVRKRVLDAIGDPWFKYNDGNHKGNISEDITFWKEARALGFKGYVDVDAKLGHETPMVVWPGKGGEMAIYLEISPGMVFPVQFGHEMVKDLDGTVLEEHTNVPAT